METKNKVIEIYTEYTPNPESLKFVCNEMLLPGKSLDFRAVESVSNSPLATELFELTYVQGVFIANNFVTITKGPEHSWEEIIPEVRQFLKDYLLSKKPIVTEEEPPSAKNSPKGDNGLENRIIELLDTYVKPAVEMDGGAIRFKSFENGVVTLMLQGSCSGCPSSMITLKQGIEGLLQKMIPEVKEVIAEEA